MQSDKFNLEFSALYQEIEAKVKRIKSNECEDVKQVLDESLQQFDSLKEKLDLNGAHLPQYVRRTSQEKINQLSQWLNEAKNVMKPKKAFKFNAKRPQQIKPSKDGDKSEQVNDQLDSKTQSGEEDSENDVCKFCGLKDRNDEVLRLNSEQVNGQEIQLRNLTKCEVNIYGNPSTVHIINCTNCKLNIGPVSTSVFIDKCTQTEFQLFCQQLRFHNTYDCTFYLHVCTRGIIEDSSRLKFSVYSFNYDQLEEHIISSKLNRASNNWDKIEDFNWLVKDQQSPNWEKLT